MDEPPESSFASWSPAGPVAGWLDAPPGGLGGGASGAGGEADERHAPLRESWLRTVFRFTRADGSPVFGPRGKRDARLAELARWVRRLDDRQLDRVLGWWRPARSADEGGWTSPPLPTAGWLDRPLAVMRPDWMARGDCVAVDHRGDGGSSLIEVAGRGATWLGPGWSSPSLDGPIGPARATYWSTGSSADAFEWSFRAGAVDVTRTAILIRGGHLALLMQAELGAGPGVGEVRWDLPDGVDARPDPARRALILSAGRGRAAARLVPIGLPDAPYATERGGLEVDGRAVVLRQRTEGPNRCLALLACWRKEPPRDWRVLTVAENSAACPPGTAFAARVGWGVKQTSLLVYRSLGPAGLRSVLGHQTRARLVVGAFTPTGDVRPWIKATDDEPPARG